MNNNMDIMNLNKLKEIARNYSPDEQRAVLEVLDINFILERVRNDLIRFKELQDKVNELKIFNN